MGPKFGCVLKPGNHFYERILERVGPCFQKGFGYSMTCRAMARHTLLLEVYTNKYMRAPDVSQTTNPLARRAKARHALLLDVHTNKYMPDFGISCYNTTCHVIARHALLLDMYKNKYMRASGPSYDNITSHALTSHAEVFRYE